MRKKVRTKLPSSSFQTPTLTPEEQQELDFDVCCCIEEIQNSLLRSPTEKQKKLAEVSLKILKSPSEIHVKKKQIIRQWISDYKSNFESKKKEVISNLNENKFAFRKAVASQNSMCFRKHFARHAEDNLNASANYEYKLSNGTKIETFLNNNKNSCKTGDNAFMFAF